MDTLSPVETNPRPRKRRLWLGSVAALVTLAGASALLEGALVLAGRVWAAATDAPDVWTEHLHGVDANGWLALFPIAFLSSALAGLVGAWFGPKRSRAMLAALLTLSLVYLVFQPLPPKASGIVLILWSACWPAGIGVGTLILWQRERQALKEPS